MREINAWLSEVTKFDGGAQIPSMNDKKRIQIEQLEAIGECNHFQKYNAFCKLYRRRFRASEP